MRFLITIFGALLIVCPYSFANSASDAAMRPSEVKNTPLQDRSASDSLEVASGNYCTYRPLNIPESLKKKLELHGYRFSNDNSVSSTLELETTEIESKRTGDTILQSVQLDTCFKFDGYFGRYRSCDRKIIHFDSERFYLREKKTDRAISKSTANVLRRNYCK